MSMLLADACIDQEVSGGRERESLLCRLLVRFQTVVQMGASNDV